MRLVVTLIINFCAMLVTPIEWPFYRRLAASVLMGLVVLFLATIAYPELSQ